MLEKEVELIDVIFSQAEYPEVQTSNIPRSKSRIHIP
jgi:hypothetical protein